MQKYNQIISGFKLVALAAFLLITSLASAQKIEGSVRYMMTNDWAKKMAAVDYLSKQAVDKMTYMIGDRGVYKTYSRLFITPSQTKYEDSDESVGKGDAGYSWLQDAYTITRNYEKKIFRDIIDMAGKTDIVEDSIHAPKWKILNEMKEIEGHICMNAQWNDTIKKQKVIGWFALDILNSGGPERFFGLPGLIMEININDGALVITADQIALKKLTTELDLPKKIKGKKIKETEYYAILRKYMEEKKKAEQPYFWSMRY